MTEGIIQQVFKRWSIYRLNTTNDSLEDLEKELIEKIKQEIPYFTGETSTTTRLLLRKLIGDNE